MSLINDALKRAKETQSNTPPSPPENLRLRPAETALPKKNGVGLVLPATAITVALAAAFSFWQLHGSNRVTVQSKSNASVPVINNPRVPRTEIASLDSRADANVQAAAATPQPETTGQQSLVTNTTTAIVQAAPPPPPSPQLKAIIFNPARPSALIDDKTVFVGDKVREFRVTAITPSSATLTSATETKVLTLE